MNDPYLLWKTVHIVSAAVLFGGGIGIAFFCWFGTRAALRAGDIGALRALLRLTVVADACLTAPAVLVQAASGLALMQTLRLPLASTWSAAVWSLYMLVGACWLPVLAIQIQLRREAERSASTAALPAHFHRSFRLWFALGVPAFAAVLALFYLMVAKPLPLAGF